MSYRLAFRPYFPFLCALLSVLVIACSRTVSPPDDSQVRADIVGKRLAFHGPDIAGPFPTTSLTDSSILKLQIKDRAVDSKGGTCVVTVTLTFAAKSYTHPQAKEETWEGDIQLKYKLYDQGWRLLEGVDAKVWTVAKLPKSGTP